MAVGVAGVLVASGLASASRGAAAPGAAPAGAADAAASGECRLKRLKEADRFVDGSVMDIEKVGDQVVYYGNGHTVGRRGVERQRAFIWLGRRSDPIRVGPRGFDDDTAFELTSTGLINGESTDFGTGESVSWVQDLATMQVTFFDLDSGPRGADHGYGYLRRINDAGAAAGSVSRSDDWRDGDDAVAFDSPSADLEILSGSTEAVLAGVFGVNNAGERAGVMGTEFLPDDPDFLIFDAMKWNADGTRTELVSPHGLDALARSIKDDGTASGWLLWGDDPATAHIEASYWPSPDVNVALGIARGGGFSDAFGMDEGGWLVGMTDRLAPRSRFAEDDMVAHGFLRTPDTAEGTLRILPSLYGARHDLGWKQWSGSAVHAVNAELNLVGSGSHWKFVDGEVRRAPTVWINADQCGREVNTTHTPFWLRDQGSAARRAGAPRSHSVATYKAAVTQR